MTELESLKRELLFLVNDRNNRVNWYRQQIEAANRRFDERAMEIRRKIVKLDPESARIPVVSATKTERRNRTKKTGRKFIVLKSDGTEMEIEA